MSGGRFNYDQYKINEIVEAIQDVIDNNKVPYSQKELRRDTWLTPGSMRYEYEDETIEKFKEGADILKRAYVYAQRIDWLLSSDDGESTFHERLKKDLEKLK
jgi:hypothetical protein